MSTSHRLAIVFVLPLSSAVSFAQAVTLESINSQGIHGTISSTASPIANQPDLSNDGRFVVFATAANNIAPIDGTSSTDIFVRDRYNGEVECASLTLSGTGTVQGCGGGRISGDGRFVAFYSDDTNLVVGDGNGKQDVFVRDLLTDTTERVSISSTGAEADHYSSTPDVNFDGRFVAFSSIATNLVPGDVPFTNDVYCRDRLLGITELVTATVAGVPANGSGGNVAISGDGRYVVYQTTASNLVAGDTNGFVDVYLRDRSTGTNELISVDSSGALANGDSWLADVSDDGRYVVYESRASNLISGDTNAQYDVFLRDRLLGITTCLSVDSVGVVGDRDSSSPSISRDGRFVAFGSRATTLVAPDTNGAWDVLRRDLSTGALTRESDTAYGLQSDGASFGPRLGGDGRWIAFASEAKNLVWNAPIYGDVYLRDTELASPSILLYCTPKVNSSGCVPEISTVGTPYASGLDSFFVVAHHVLPGKNGLLFWGSSPMATPFAGGTLCVAPPVVRTTVQAAGTAATPQPCWGTYSHQFRQSYMAAHGLAAGATVYAQFWGRDGGFAAPNNITLTAAIQFTIVN